MTTQTIKTKARAEYNEKVNELRRLLPINTDEEKEVSEPVDFGYKCRVGDDIWTVTDFGVIGTFIDQKIDEAVKEERERFVHVLKKLAKKTKTGSTFQDGRYSGIQDAIQQITGEGEV